MYFKLMFDVDARTDVACSEWRFLWRMLSQALVKALEDQLAVKSDELRLALEREDKAREAQRTATTNLNQALERETRHVSVC